MSVVIRHADPRDAERLVDLASAVAGEPEGWLLADSRWRSAQQERRYIRLLRGHPDAALLLAETDGGAIVGRLSVSRDPHPSSAHVADLGLMVAGSHRRQGIASALMQAVEEWARAAEVRKLELHVFPHNAPARTLYAKLGYREEGLRHEHYRRPDGRYADAVLMAKRLD
jgi:RimJ/RimL family protein N-acetyltransferase